MATNTALPQPIGPPVANFVSRSSVAEIGCERKRREPLRGQQLAQVRLEPSRQPQLLACEVECGVG
jgi:hypothetical protein